MKKTVFFLLVFALSLSLRAQNEYRISQPIPDSVNYHITIPAGCEVRIVTADHASVSIVNSPQVFFAEGSELQVSVVKNNQLTVVDQQEMPHNIVIEIAVKWPLEGLDVGKGARVATGALTFVPNSTLSIANGAQVSGTVWSGLGDMDVNVWYDARLQLDTLRAKGALELYRASGSSVECPVVEGSTGSLTLDRRSQGTDYLSLAPQNLEVKSVSHQWRRTINQATLSVGFLMPLTFYRNNQYGSAYNLDQTYSFHMVMGPNEIPLGKRWSLHTGLIVEEKWGRLLNHVTTDGQQLTVTTPSSGLLPRQSLNQTLVGLDWKFNYGIGSYNPEKERYPLSAQFGLSIMYSPKGTLITRTQGTDNRWSRVKEEADVFNPWQIRANVGFSLGPLIGSRIDFFYDLLPTFRPGIGANDIHCMGISIGF